MTKRYTIKRAEGVQFRINYEKELDAQQYEVVTAENGPTLVIAGAGSGKTRAVTYRVARLIETGIAPDRILLVTFTNKAAREMLQRVDLLVKTDVKRIWGGTFHSMGNRILRRCAEVIGYQPNFSILDSEDAKDIIEASLEEAKIDLKNKRFPKPALLQDLHSLAVNKDVAWRDLLGSQFQDLLPLAEQIEQVLQIYQRRKVAANAMDYDDLLVNWKRAMVESKDVLQTWSQHFQHVLVDEYQDTNKLQSDIVDLMATEHRNIMVVGDDAQSIYGWRGANFENIYRFSERYPDAKQLKLENNYRSRPEILALANRSISNNVKQFPKNLHAMRVSAGEKPALVPLANVDEQAAFVCSRILELHDQGAPLSELAVLYRSHWQSLELQLELTRRGIPYSIRSGMRFFEQAHIKDLIAHLRIIINPKDEAAWKRILKLVPSIGRTTAHRIWECIAAADEPLKMIARDDFRAKPRAIEAWRSFVALLLQLGSDEMKNKPSAQIELILASGYSEYLRTTYENADSRLEDLHQLANYAARFDDVQNFLSELSLIGSERFGVPDGPAGQDAVDVEEESDHIVLTSIHQAKGLEWQAVFVVWAADAKFPSARSLRDQTAIEEERRLFYVAVTRAKDELYVCYPLIESDYTRMSVIQRPSRFISEVGEDFFEVWSID
ncbi:MAG TPA: ATP-dependent helicase [Candidatus Obscuribacterales bacterium]